MTADVATDQISSRNDAGLVVSMRVAARHTLVDYVDGDGIETVQLPALPDTEAASRLAATLRRLCWVAITVHPDGCVEADLSAIGHRVPVRRGIRLETALGLGARQVPTVIRRTAEARS